MSCPGDFRAYLLAERRSLCPGFDKLVRLKPDWANRLHVIC